MAGFLILRKFAFCIFLFIAGAKVSRSQAGVVEPNQLELPGSASTITFCWQGDSIGGRWEPYAALLLPVKLLNCPRVFYLQFDLGAPTSLFYKEKLSDIRAKYPKALSGQDTAALTSFVFHVGKMQVLARRISLHATSGKPVDWNRDAREIIGTIGADLIDNRVMVLDYPNKQLTLSGTIPAKLGSVPLVDFMYARRSVLIPAQVKGKQTYLFFDTGSSAFELLTGKETAGSFPRTDSSVLRYPVRSWDHLMTANTYQVTDSITIVGTALPLREVTYMEGTTKSQVDRMMSLGIGGMLGNKIFLQSVLILDTKQKKLGVSETGASKK